MINYISPFIISITLQESALACRWGEPSHSAINCELKQIDGHRSLFIFAIVHENWSLREYMRRGKPAWRRRRAEMRKLKCQYEIAQLFIHLSCTGQYLLISILSLRFNLSRRAVLKCDSHRLRIALIKHLPLLSRQRTPLFTFRLYCPKKRRSRLPGLFMNVRWNESKARHVYIAIMNLVSRVNEPTWELRATFLIAIEKAVANIIAAVLIALLSKFH